MATSQLVQNSLENKLNNNRDYSNYVDPEKARQYFETSDMLRANADKYNLNPFSSTSNYGLNNNQSTSYNTGALINPNLNNLNTSYTGSKNLNYDTSNLTTQLQNISNKIGNYANNLTSKEEYLSNLTSRITELINKQKQATVDQYNMAYQNEMDQLNYAKDQATKTAKEQQRKIAGTKAQQLLSLDKALAKQGLSGSGEAISNRLALDIASEENSNNIGLNLQDKLSEYDMQGLIALRNKDDGIKSALAQIDSDEASYMLSAYEEAENYNMNVLNYQLSIAQTQADIQTAIDEAKYRQAQFEEGIREYNESLAEQIRQYNEDLAERKRQYDTTFAENQRQYNNSLAEQVRQFNENLAYNKKVNSLDEDYGDLITNINNYNTNTSNNSLLTNNNTKNIAIAKTVAGTSASNNINPLKFTKGGYFTINKSK